MILNKNDTIVAQATPKGKGGIGIIRISGNQTSKIANIILGKIPKPRYANYMNFLDLNKNILDKGIAIWFPKPKSFTGEDVLELHGHGGQLIINIILKNIIKIPKVRIANPGEFSERAFLNNKIDLIQAEAIIDLINASSEQGVRSAICSLQGNFSKIIDKLLQSITDIRTFIETSIDFSEEEINKNSEIKFKNELKSILKNINISIKEAKNKKIHEGIKVVIAGNTNVGKSSLMNILTGKQTSIITNIAGTTRDILRDDIELKTFDNNSILIQIIDTAGLRKTNNLIESIGIKMAYEEIKIADHLLYVIDYTKSKDNIHLEDTLKSISENYIQKKNITVIYNKIDLTKEKPRIEKIKNYTKIFLSSLTGEGINLLLDHLQNIFYLSNHSIPDNNIFLARIRHVKSLEKVKKNIKNSIIYISDKNITNELLAEELRLAQKHMGEITGVFTSENLLDSIFSKFCIGK